MKNKVHFKSILIAGVSLLLNFNVNAQTPPNGDCDKVLNFNTTDNLIKVNKSVQLSGNYTIAGWRFV